ncbi:MULTISPECIES: hypothetical protein [unclassified Oleiphilus]|nr:MULTISPECIES: hypothetical protein [unclassified Oleiphilus]
MWYKDAENFLCLVIKILLSIWAVKGDAGNELGISIKAGADTMEAIIFTE